MTIRIRVKTVDFNGWCGRDFHPQHVHEGMEGTVTNIDLEPAQHGHIGEEPSDRLHVVEDPYDPRNHPIAKLTDGAFGNQIFYAVMDNGDRVELMGHEFALVSCNHDGDV